MKTFMAKKKRQGQATESQESSASLSTPTSVQSKERIVHDDEQAELLVTSGEGEYQQHRQSWTDSDSDVTGESVKDSGAENGAGVTASFLEQPRL